jgi:hypothetical protein
MIVYTGRKLSKQVRNFLAKIKRAIVVLKEWGSRDVTVQNFSIRQTRNGTSFLPYPIKLILDGVVYGEEETKLSETNKVYHITHHPSWWKNVAQTEHFEQLDFHKRLIKVQQDYVILITKAPLEAKA